MLEIIEAIEGPLSSKMLMSDGLDFGSQSRLRNALDQVASTARQQLAAIKISEIIEEANVSLATT